MKKLSIIFLSLFFLVPLVQAGSSSKYSKILNSNTKSDKVYRTEDLSASIIWHATMLTDEMINAQAREYARIYDLDEDKENQVLEQRRSKRDGKLLFFVSFFTSNQKFADLKDEKAGWDLRLNFGDTELKPAKIEVANAYPLEGAFYPYHDQWSKAYYVWFDQDPKMGAQPFTLSLYGVKAKSILHWK
ncbi:hypothetical protein K1X76_04010 [bacterium]|nr:hypothetical protein [bacterium]